MSYLNELETKTTFFKPATPAIPAIPAINEQKQTVTVANELLLPAILGGDSAIFDENSNRIADSSKRIANPPSVQPIELIDNIKDNSKNSRNSRVQGYEKPIQVKTMSVCLDGDPCSSIYVLDNRQMCRRNNQPIFDMIACPMDKWFTCGQVSGDTRPGNGETIWCSINCEHGQCNTINEMPVLWCQVSDKAVIDLDRCPGGHWTRDSKGMPI